jgi:ATP-dependent exoDNAse (exonuclease V) alpha subunit
MEMLNERFVPVPEDRDYYITLCSRNDIADRINNEELHKIQEEFHLYNAKVVGNFQFRLFPTEQVLKIKKGAQVMFVKNDPQKRFVNGTIGKVTYCEDDEIRVVIFNENKGEYEEIDLEKLEWEILRYKYDPDQPKKIVTETVGSFIQFPIKLAWAITIHKSQGKTFEKVIIDLGRGAFEYGQTYVALSRCKTLEGIILKQPIRPRDIMTDERIIEWYETYR